METLRHYSRYVVNGIAFALAVLALPELGAIVPTEQLPFIVALAGVLNTVLSLLRGLV